MKVLKFGGSSVADPKAIARTLSVVRQSDAPLLVVVSALGGVTDLLLEAAALVKAMEEKFGVTAAAAVAAAPARSPRPMTT